MYRVTLEDFEGPLDLLLFFIQRDELDIYDIPIARITNEFLEYVRLMEEIDLDGVGDFIYFAALLISIKVRMLLPRPELDDEGEPIDPRTELVERLLEYVRYKEAAEDLAVQHERRGELFTRGAASAQRVHFEEETPEMLVNTSIFDLISALESILAEVPDEPLHEVEEVEYTVDHQRSYVVDQLRQHGKTTFRKLAHHWHKGFIIATFLAILEMAKRGRVWLTMTEAADDFYVEPQELEIEGTNGVQEEREDATP